MPPATMDAFRNHGVPRAALEEDADAARGVLETLERLDISLEQITDRLLEDGIQLFVTAFDKLLNAVEQGMAAAATKHIDGTSCTLPAGIEGS